MSLTSGQSARQLEREADDTRRRLSATLDNLADNLTPGRMLDEVIAYSRGGGASFLKGLGNAASTNPLPTLLIGVGAAMFLVWQGSDGFHSQELRRSLQPLEWARRQQTGGVGKRRIHFAFRSWLCSLETPARQSVTPLDQPHPA